MTSPSDSLRTDSTTRVILATPRALYRAHLDAELLAKWRVPDGMRAEVLAFDGRLGGGYRMALHYEGADTAIEGKSGAGVDRFSGRFDELIPDEKIVEAIRFESDDPAFARAMIVTTSLREVRDGTKVTVACSQVPASVSREDHMKGMNEALRKLAALTE